MLVDNFPFTGAGWKVAQRRLFHCPRSYRPSSQPGLGMGGRRRREGPRCLKHQAFPLAHQSISLHPASTRIFPSYTLSPSLLLCSVLRSSYPTTFIFEFFPAALLRSFFFAALRAQYTPDFGSPSLCCHVPASKHQYTSLGARQLHRKNFPSRKSSDDHKKSSYIKSPAASRSDCFYRHLPGSQAPERLSSILFRAFRLTCPS